MGQKLTALGLNLEMVRTQMGQGAPDVVHSRLADSFTLVEETAERIRGVMADLRPPMLDDCGLVATLRWCSDKFASRTGVAVAMEGEELVPRLPAEVESAILRIVQEALTNVAKHAQAAQVTISVSADDEDVHLVVADDGVGFDPDQLAAADESQSWGLVIMSERAAAVDARCRVESQPERGTRVIVEVTR